MLAEVQDLSFPRQYAIRSLLGDQGRGRVVLVGVTVHLMSPQRESLLDIVSRTLYSLCTSLRRWA